mgnify:CR=1 FL=1
MSLLALEVGVGTNRFYPFRPKTPINYMPVFLDVEEPSEELRDWWWILGDAEYLPFRDRVFDLIVASHVIEHLVNPARFLMECWRVLRSGGVLELRTPNFLSVNSRADPNHKHVFNIFRLYRMLKRLGFMVVLEHSVGSLIKPKLLRALLSYAINFLCDELSVRGVKT